MHPISRSYRALLVIAAAAVTACSNSEMTTAIPTFAGSSASLSLPAVNVQYATLNYQNGSGHALSTFLTGIRGDNISGMYVKRNGRERGFIYHPSTQQFVALDYPGAYNTTPYGPSFGPNGSSRAVGSYTVPNQKLNHGFFYDGSQPKGRQFVPIDYPNATNTIPHSTYRNSIVGNWDKLETGNSDFLNYPTVGRGFIYDLRAQTYKVFSIPGSKSTTCYGVIDGAIAGGYTKPHGIHVTHAYVYDTSSNALYAYDHPGSVITHFEGIAINGKRGNYSLTGDWVALNGTVRAFYIAMKGWKYQLPVDIMYPNAQTSGNSVYSQDGLTQVIGVYSVGSASPATNGYIAYLH
jgi:subtilase-type serine protease